MVIQQPTPSTGPRFRDVPVIMTDTDGVPFTTELRYVNGLFTWVVVGITCAVTGEWNIRYFMWECGSVYDKGIIGELIYLIQSKMF